MAGVDSEWYNDDSVTNLLPPAALEKRSKEKNLKAEGKKESMKEEMKALAACVSVRQACLRQETAPAARTSIQAQLDQYAAQLAVLEGEMDALNAPVKLLVVVQEEKTESHELECLKKGKEKAKEIGEKGSKERHFYTIKLVHDLKSTARDQ